jgi:hypothetical protein
VEGSLNLNLRHDETPIRNTVRSRGWVTDDDFSGRGGGADIYLPLGDDFVALRFVERRIRLVDKPMSDFSLAGIDDAHWWWLEAPELSMICFFFLKKNKKKNHT